jgi:hypothetical protein
MLKEMVSVTASSEWLRVALVLMVVAATLEWAPLT